VIRVWGLDLDLEDDKEEIVVGSVELVALLRHVGPQGDTQDA